jgi:hypothetical protein
MLIMMTKNIVKGRKNMITSVGRDLDKVYMVEKEGEQEREEEGEKEEIDK